MTTTNDPTLVTLQVSRSKLDLIERALKAYGESEQPAPKGVENVLPDAVTEPKPKEKDMPGQGKLPDSGDKTMDTKKGTEMGGDKMTIPDAGTNVKLDDGKPSTQPGEGAKPTDPKAGATVGGATESGMGTGPSDKPGFTATDIPGGEAGMAKGRKGKGKKDEDEEDEDDESDEAQLKRLEDEIKSGRKAEEARGKLYSKWEERIAAFKAEAGAMPGMPTPDMKPATGGSPAPQAVAPAAPAPASPEVPAEFKALRDFIGPMLDKHFATAQPSAVVEFKKEFDSVISQVFSPKGGSENFVNLRSPGQPAGKIAVEPGRSGSSEVYRTETGKTQGLETLDESKKNPPGTLDTAASVPLGTYEKPTELTSGPGYQMELLRRLTISERPESTFPGRRSGGSHTTYKAFLGQAGIDAKSAEEKAVEDFTKKRTAPVLKHMESWGIPTREEFEKLVKSGQLVEDLANTPEETKRTENSVLLKGLKRFAQNPSP